MKIEKTEKSSLKDFLKKICFETPFVGSLTEIMEKVEKDSLNTIPFSITTDGEAAGFFTVSLSDSKIDFLKEDLSNCWIGSFFIAEKFQGRGVAKKALEMMPKAITGYFNDLRRISLTVNKKNKGAIGLYLKSGYKDTGKIYEGGPFGPQHIFTMDISDKVTI